MHDRTPARPGEAVADLDRRAVGDHRDRRASAGEHERLMARRLMLLNVLLIGISLASVAYIARELRPRTPSFATPLGRVGQPPVSATVPTTAASPSAGDRSVVASRNLFSPTRTE